MKKILLIVVCATVLFFLGNFSVLTWAQEADPEQVIKLIQESIEMLQDVSTSLTQHNQSGGMDTSFSGTLQFKSPDKIKANIEISDNADKKLRSLSVYDGNVLWQEQTDSNNGKITVFKSIMPSAAPQAREFMRQFNPKEQLQSLLNDYAVFSVKKEEAEGRTVYVLEMEIKPQVRRKMIQMLKAFLNNAETGELIPDMAVLYWDAKTKYTARLQMYSKNQELKILTIYTNTKINSGIDEAAFTYNAPEGANIIDISDIMAEEVVKSELEGADHELVGSACPVFSLPDLFGEIVHSDALRDKVVIINFWEHWCPPCEKELPLLESLFQSVFAEEVQVLTITSDAEQAMQVVEENSYSFPVLIDKEAKLAKQLDVLSIPRTFVLDGQGVIRSVYIGYHEDIKTILTEQINLLSENEDE
ncbi:MAG: redoxin domain-containing protein [Candidatus Omnitrophota bacterium]